MVNYLDSVTVRIYHQQHEKQQKKRIQSYGSCFQGLINKLGEIKYEYTNIHDYAATTPVDPRVVDCMIPYLKQDYGLCF